MTMIPPAAPAVEAWAGRLSWLRDRPGLSPAVMPRDPSDASTRDTGPLESRPWKTSRPARPQPSRPPPPRRPPARDPRKAEFEANKLAKRLRRLVGQAIADFSHDRGGDRVMVCLSGGKDSYALLDILLALQRRAPVPLRRSSRSTSTRSSPAFPEHVLPALPRGRGVAFRIAEQDTYSVVKRVMPEGDTMCSLCSRLRRGVLYRVAGELGATKIALGHHRDDLIATFFLNLFFGGKLKTMPPKLVSDDGKHVVIRPLAYVRERDLAAYAEAKRLPDHPLHAVRLAGEPAAQAGRRDAARVGDASIRAASSRSSTRSARWSRRTCSTARCTTSRRCARPARRTRDGDIAFDVDSTLEAAADAEAAPRRGRNLRDSARAPLAAAPGAAARAARRRYFTVFWSCPKRTLRSASVRMPPAERIDLLGERVGALDRRPRLDRRQPALEVREVLDVLPLARRHAPTDSTPCRRSRSRRR